MFAAMLVAASLALPGHALAQNYPDSVKQLISATKKQIKTINIDQFKALVDNKEAGLIIDVARRSSSSTATCPAPSTCRAA
jgi:hypothetical protein